MPVEFVRDAHGRRQRSGTLSSAPALVPDVAPKPSKVVPASKPTLWSMLGNAAAYEAKRFTHDPLKRLTELGASAVHRPINDLRYEAKQLSNIKTYIPRVATYAVNALPGAAQSNSRDSQQAITTIMANTARNAIEAWQSLGGKKNPDYSVTPLGQFADFAEKRQYNLFGDKPPVEQEGLQRLGTDVRNDVYLALGLAAGGELIAGGLAGVPILGRVAAVAGNALNPLNAKTAIGGIARTAAAGAVEEALSVPFQDNSGSAAGLADMVLGTNLEPVKPGMNRVQQMQAAVGPNALAGALLPAVLGGAFHGITRGRRAAAEVADHVDARSALEGMGLTEKNPETGAIRFTEAAQQQPQGVSYADAEAAYKAKHGIGQEPAAPEAAPTPEPAPIPSAPMERGGPVLDPEAKLPEADPSADPWDVHYDESLPEADVVLHQLRQLDPEELKAIDQDTTTPVTQGIENALLSRPQTEVDPNRSWDMVSMPRANVADDYLKRYPGRVAGLDFSELRDLAFNSPQVANRLTEITGKSLDEATKTDLVKSVLSMDNVLLTNRMKGQPMTPTGDLAVVPAEMQYKSNVNAAGEQAGNSLEGVQKWDPDSEGVVSIYPDSAAAVEKLVNGYNRKALAERLGVPSLMVKRLDATTVPEARLQGAIENISAGAGTAWDAAKFVKESGLTDLKQLKDSGKSLASGHWKNAVSLSNLPGDLFLAAQNGAIDEGYAALIGGSGLPPEKMTSLFQEVAARPPADAGEVTNLILAAKSAPTGDASQVDLFGNASVDLTREKARLARDIQKNLASDKSVFGKTSRNAAAIEARTGSSIDAAGTAGVADQAKVAKRYFDSVWYQSGPVSDMLDRGAADIANGMSQTAVADRIKQQLPALLEQEMGKAGPAAVDQASLLDEVAPAPEPTPPPEPSLDELHGRLLQRAIAKGEVRPPETIIPDIPVDNGVNLQKALEEAARGEEGPNLQAAIAEEARLREEFRIRDEAVQQAALQARRDAEGYDLKTFEERKSEVMAGIEEPPANSVAGKQKANGMLDGWKEEAKAFDPSQGRPALTEEEYRAERNKKKMEPLYRELDQAKKYVAINEDMVAQLKASEPEVGTNEYGKWKRNLIKFEKEAFKEKGNVITAEMAIKRELKNQQEAVRGAAPQKAMKLSIPDQGFGGTTASFSARRESAGPRLELGDEGYIDYIETKLAEKLKDKQFEDLFGLTTNHEGSWLRAFEKSRSLSKMADESSAELALALKEAMRVSGLHLDDVNAKPYISFLEEAGPQAASGALRNWGESLLADLIEARPESPVAIALDRRTLGGYQARRSGSDLAQSLINLSITGMLNEKYGRIRGASMLSTAYHEAFHALQDRFPENVKWILDSPDGYRRTEEILRKDGYSAEDIADMDLREVQAEAFGIWAAKKKLRQIRSNPVDKLFLMLDSARLAIDKFLKKGVTKDLSTRSLFEIAYAGGPESFKELSRVDTHHLIDWAGEIDPHMERIAPDLTRMVKQEIDNRYASLKQSLEDLMEEAKRGAC